MSRFGEPVTVTRQAVRVLADRREVYEDDPSDSGTGGFIIQRSCGLQPLFQATPGFKRAQRYTHPNHSRLGEGWPDWPGIGISEEEAPQPRHRWMDPALRKPYDVAPVVELDPKKRVANWVRWRRVVLDEPLAGIVVGTVTLQEGHVEPRTNANPYGDGDQPYFAQQRRVPLMEVAVEPDGRARLMLVWHGDVAPREWPETTR